MTEAEVQRLMGLADDYATEAVTGIPVPMSRPTARAALESALRELLPAGIAAPAAQQPDPHADIVAWANQSADPSWPWPTVTRYSGGASTEGLHGRVWLRLQDGGPDVEYVPATTAPAAPANALGDAADATVVSLGRRGAVNLLAIERIEPRGEYPDEVTLVMKSGERFSVSARAAGWSAKADAMTAWTRRMSAAIAKSGGGAAPEVPADARDAEWRSLMLQLAEQVQSAADHDFGRVQCQDSVRLQAMAARARAMAAPQPKE